MYRSTVRIGWGYPNKMFDETKSFKTDAFLTTSDAKIKLKTKKRTQNLSLRDYRQVLDIYARKNT
ncbi:hypothetical protein GCM10011273_28340 [Asticcacaulis endophyticus]|uniref:Uncharacterized protein n=1 Tax=Asticcacaulis endophyticus TaxID=1395890 RepID=A0A918QAP9_9CAUL|nr:hypothetical protein GCM10011273_28340 [Asticcacaulis endophyticus]